MKTLGLIASLALLSAGCATMSIGPDAGSDEMQPDKPVEQHVWLQQLVGEWDVQVTGEMGPDQPFEMNSTDSTSAFGDLWVISKGSMDMGGTQVDSLLTLGYDPAKEHFVGTWVSSMHANLWTYTGQLDFDKKVLTLEAKGPHFSDPSIITRYRDIIEITGPDTRTLTSKMEGLDGNWPTYMTAKYTRRK